jgi:hypothetical protein
VNARKPATTPMINARNMITAGLPDGDDNAAYQQIVFEA